MTALLLWTGGAVVTFLLMTLGYFREKPVHAPWRVIDVILVALFVAAWPAAIVAAFCVAMVRRLRRGAP